jgi:hypothetical protein
MVGLHNHSMRIFFKGICPKNKLKGELDQLSLLGLNMTYHVLYRHFHLRIRHVRHWKVVIIQISPSYSPTMT